MWTAKVNGSYDAGWGIRLTPALRFQQGQPFGRTFLAGAANGINYGTQRILAEPIDSQRQDDIAILDIRTEKFFNLGEPPALRRLLRRLQPDQRRRRAEHQLGQRVVVSLPVTIIGPTNHAVRREVRLVGTEVRSTDGFKARRFKARGSKGIAGSPVLNKLAARRPGAPRGRG